MYLLILKITLLKINSQEKTFKTMLNEYKINLKKSILQINKNMVSHIPVIIIHHSQAEYKKELFGYSLSYDEVELIENIFIQNYENLKKLFPKMKIIYARKSKNNFHFNEPDLILKSVKSLL